MELILRAIAFFLVVGVPLFLIFGQPVIGRWLGVRERRLELQAQLALARAAERDGKTDRLEQRLRVLERIVTERGFALGDEIDNLRDSPASQESLFSSPGLASSPDQYAAHGGDSNCVPAGAMRISLRGEGRDP